MERSSRRTGRRALLLQALESQMAGKPLSEVNVEDVATEAGITRTRFYFYFDSKYEALAAALLDISDELVRAYLAPGSWFVRPVDTRPRVALELAFQSVLKVWREHGPVLREVADLWNAVPTVREAYDSFIDRLVDLTAARIEAERAAGIAPHGPAARDLARGLLWGGERILTLWLIESRHALSVEGMFDTELALWMRTIYLQDDPAVPHAG